MPRSLRGLGPALLLLLAACPGAQFPQIEAETPQWQEDERGSFVQIVKVLRAKVTNLAPVATIKVVVRFSRHQWLPGAANAFSGDASREGPGSDFFAFSLPEPSDFRNSQLVFFEWFVVDRQPDGSETILAETPVQSFRVGCAGTASEVMMKGDQDAVVGAFDNPRHFPPPGYLLPHRHVSFKGVGVSAARFVTIDPFHQPELGKPDLLSYAPGNPEPSHLVGWTYVAPYDPNKRPTFHCFPYEAWFFHPGGWHTSDGLFVEQPNPLIPAPRPRTRLGPHAPPPLWHGPMWVAQLWRRDGDVPLLAKADPTVAQGADDVAIPDNWFQDRAPIPFP